MRLHFLGGADEVGASAVLVEAAGRRILVDAGVRMGAAARRDPLPDLARVTELGGLDAVLLTHAHLDHSGALPLVHGAFPSAPVWMTAPTLDLVRVLLLDALKIMESRADREDEIPLYPLAAVEALLARVTPVAPLEPVALFSGGAGHPEKGEVQVTFFPAGHVLGAASVGIETPEGRVLVTGDVSLTDQLTVPGMARPRFAPDVVVCESTYGNRLHASRRAEEERFAGAVLETLRAGGKVLVPAFALGRAQEVLLLLRRVLGAPDAPVAPVRFDGMVRAICGIYAQHRDWLTPALRDRAEAGRGLFETADGRVRAVRDPAERTALVEDGPSVVVSSSGMLTGGPSAQYALALAGDPDALIAITGYQDEEAPGRRLQELAAGATRDLVIDGRSVEVRCRVGTYGLSAHADASELAGLLGSLKPPVVALVHGDGGARAALAERLLAETGIREVHLPAIGDVISVEGRRDPRVLRAAKALHISEPRRQKGRAGDGMGPQAGERTANRASNQIGEASYSFQQHDLHSVTSLPGTRHLGERPRERHLDEEAILALHGMLWKEAPRGKTYTAAELAERWYGPGGVPEDLGPVRALITGARGLFAPDRKRPYLFRLADPAEARISSGAGANVAPGVLVRDQDGRLEQNAALALADALIGAERGLYRRGADRERWTLRLYFHFPDVARDACASELLRLAEETGWEVTVHPEAHLASLDEVTRSLLRELADLEPLRAPSVRVDSRLVTVQVDSLPPSDTEVALRQALCERTGFSLCLERGHVAGPVAGSEKRDASGRLEINQAFVAIDLAFREGGPRPTRKSKRAGPNGPFIELSFVSPEVGERQRAVLDALWAKTGWPIHIADRVDQQAVLGLARAHIPPSWSVRKGPGLDLPGRKLRLKLDGPVPEDEKSAFEAVLTEETGFSLIIE